MDTNTITAISNSMSWPEVYGQLLLWSTFEKMQRIGGAMKAKEYAQPIIEMAKRHRIELEDKKEDQTEFKKIKEAEEATILNRTLNDFGQESVSLIHQRKGKHDEIRYSVMEAIINELSDKWKALAKIVNKELGIQYIREDGFINWHKNKFKAFHRYLEMDRTMKEYQKIMNDKKGTF